MSRRGSGVFSPLPDFATNRAAAGDAPTRRRRRRRRRRRHRLSFDSSPRLPGVQSGVGSFPSRDVTLRKDFRVAALFFPFDESHS